MAVTDSCWRVRHRWKFSRGYGGTEMPFRDTSPLYQSEALVNLCLFIAKRKSSICFNWLCYDYSKGVLILVYPKYFEKNSCAPLTQILNAVMLYAGFECWMWCNDFNLHLVLVCIYLLGWGPAKSMQLLHPCCPPPQKKNVMTNLLWQILNSSSLRNLS